MLRSSNTSASSHRWWHHPMSRAARLRIATALMGAGLASGALQWAALSSVGLVAFAMGMVLYLLLIPLLFAELFASFTGAMPHSPSYLRIGMIGMFAGLVLAALVLLRLSTLVSPLDPFGATAVLWLAPPITAFFVGGSSLLGTIVGSRSGGANTMIDDRH